MHHTIESFLTASEEVEVVNAIRTAEKNTSGEIRIHLENSSKGYVNKRAFKVFGVLKMQNTKLQNGVLIYVAVKDKSFAIYGGKGINDVVKDDFWDTTKDIIQTHFIENKFKQGLIDGVISVGEQLRHYFPIGGGLDKDELSNEISKR